MSYCIPNEKYDEGLKLCLENVVRLTKLSKLVLENNNTAFAFGLYTYAIEEYGKFIVMRDESKKSKNGYLVPNWIFGGNKNKRSLSHKSKLERAIQKIPSKCKTVSLGTYYRDYRTSEDQIIHFGSNASIKIPANTSGVWEAIQSPDFDVRLRSFYLDWDDAVKEWVLPYTPHKKELIKSINAFLSHVPTGNTKKCVPST